MCLFSRSLDSTLKIFVFILLQFSPSSFLSFSHVYILNFQNSVRSAWFINKNATQCSSLFAHFEYNFEQIIFIFSSRKFINMHAKSDIPCRVTYEFRRRLFAGPVVFVGHRQQVSAAQADQARQRHPTHCRPSQQKF